MIIEPIYQNIQQTITFQEDYVLIEIGDVFKGEYHYNEISKVYFNIDEDGYYFRILDIACIQFQFDYQNKTKYRIKNEKILFQKVKNKEIQLIPNFGWYDYGDGIIEYCKMKKKYFLSIMKIRRFNTTERTFSDMNSFALNYGAINRFSYRGIDNDLKSLNLQEELSTSHKYNDYKDHKEFNIPEVLHNIKLEQQAVNFGILGVLIIDKSMTFDMGYAITLAKYMIHYKRPRPAEISSNIFYSFNEKEIKNKIKELLSASYDISSENFETTF